jgi:hypothetical protein
MINARDAAATVARVSFRDIWNAVAPTITTARPSAASGVSHVAMLTAPGRISPSDATTSAHVAIVRLKMQHRMQHEERGKQNLQDPQSNVHCMIAFSASYSSLRCRSYIHTVSEIVLYVQEKIVENLLWSMRKVRE